MRTEPKLGLPLVVLFAVAACDGGELAPPEYNLGREIIETFAAHVGEDPSDIRVRDGALDYLRRTNPEIAEAIGGYVEETGIALPAWTGHYILLPRIPRVIHSFVRRSPPSSFQIGYGGIRPGCVYVMPLDRLEGGGCESRRAGKGL